ncbi:MAG: alpha/beta hydrolase [Chitinophagales bacterium]
MQKHEIEITKTARYFTLGELNENTNTIWFVLHGYAQTAEDFLESLKPLQQENTFIIAPEGLSRFYWRDFSNNPVASWMTKTDREVDIDDNMKYLSKLYKSLFSKVNLSNIKVNYLGFSQGAATLSRWLFQENLKVNNVFFYAGNIATDLNYASSKQYINANLYFIYGDNDFFIKQKDADALLFFFKKNNLKLNIFTFEGKHIITETALNYIIKQ